MSFTPFSITLGLMVRELHHSLCLAMLSENSVPVITNLLKCMAVLVQNCPYHRLGVGLITKLVRNIKAYFRHKDADVRTACLTVLGSIVSLEPALPEVTELLLRPSRPCVRTQERQSESRAVPVIQQDSKEHLEEVDPFESDEEDSTEEARSPAGHLSWLLEACLENLGVVCPNHQPKQSSQGIIPASVKVESLQVLAVLCRNYFLSVVAASLTLVIEALEQSFLEANPNMQLHTARVINSLGNSMQICLREQGYEVIVGVSHMVRFWQSMLSGQLTKLVQNADQTNLRSVGCDCLASIGPRVFEQLPRNKQILIIALLFGCSRDETTNVRSSAVRALAICVHFPTLREDIHFVIDTGESVMRALGDECVGLRVKASWSMGNFCEVLVLNKSVHF